MNDNILLGSPTTVQIAPMKTECANKEKMMGPRRRSWTDRTRVRGSAAGSSSGGYKHHPKGALSIRQGTDGAAGSRNLDRDRVGGVTYARR